MFSGKDSAARRARRPGSGRPQARTVAVVIAAATGLGLLTLGMIAWTRPATVAATHPVEVRQQAGMTYDARSNRSAAYPTGQVRTGDPVFLRLVPTMDIAINYQAELVGRPLDTTGLIGTRRVTAELRSSNGWHRGFELLPRAGFTGGSFDSIAPLDLSRVRALVTGVKQATGVDNGRFTLSIRSEIALSGTIPGRIVGTSVRESFFPELNFGYDGRQLQLIGKGTGPITEVLVKSSSAVMVPATGANHLNVLDRALPVGLLRTGGPAIGLILLLAAGLGERSRRRARRVVPERVVRRIVLEDDGTPAPPVRTTIATRPSAGSRARVPGPRAAALGERQWARTHPGSHERD
jgi:hypothetical protein